MLHGRGRFHYEPGSSLTQLEISDLRADDESLYKCELTYLAVRDECSVIQFVNLTTIAEPTGLHVHLGDDEDGHPGTEVPSGAQLGPFTEGTRLTVTCQARGGKPQAAVSWWNGTLNIAGSTGASEADTTSGGGSSTLHLQLTRYDVGAEMECQASHPAITSPLRAGFTISMHVSPHRVTLSGPGRPVSVGSRVTLLCTAHSALPAATVTWWRDGQLLTHPTTTRHRVQNDGTISTISEYAVTLRVTDDGVRLQCRAANAVTDRSGVAVTSAAVTLDVTYAPIVTIDAGILRVNQSSDVTISCAYRANPANITSVQWYRDDVLLDPSSPHYQMEAEPSPSLLVRDVTRLQAGNFSCHVSNSRGTGLPAAPAQLIVLEPLQMRLSVWPTLVRESELDDVTLRCNVIRSVSGAMTSPLAAVAWYRDGLLLNTQSVVNCSAREDVGGCGSSFRLQRVDRSHRGGYSCAGLSPAGWGPVSRAQPLNVHYAPSRPHLVVTPAPAVKGSALSLSCDLEDPGNPPANRYIWMRGHHVFTDVTERQWNISTVSPQHNTTFSCVAANTAGNSPVARTAVLVTAAPRLLRRLPERVAPPVNGSTAQLICQVECFPLCHVHWLRNGQLIENSTDEMIVTERVAADAGSDTLPSVLSTLYLTAAAGGGATVHPAEVEQTAEETISCVGAANGQGAAVTSNATLGLHDDVSVTTSLLELVEGDPAAQVTCSSKTTAAHQNYSWSKEGVLVQQGRMLLLGDAHQRVHRSHAGHYMCRISGQHGAADASAPVVVTVYYAPKCRLHRTTGVDGLPRLTCRADGAPPQLTFSWWLDDRPLTSASASAQQDVSWLTLTQQQLQATAVVACRAANGVGDGAVCRVQLTPESGELSEISSRKQVLAAGGVTLAVVLVLVIVFVTIFIRRRRQSEVKHDISAQFQDHNGRYWSEYCAPSLLPDSVASMRRDGTVVTLRRVDFNPGSLPEGAVRWDAPSPPDASLRRDGSTFGASARIGGSTGPSLGAANHSARCREPSPSRPSSALSHNDSSGYGSCASRGPAHGSGRSASGSGSGLQWSRHSPPPSPAPAEQQPFVSPPSPDHRCRCRPDTSQSDSSGRCRSCSSRGGRQTAAPLRPSPLVVDDASHHSVAATAPPLPRGVGVGNYAPTTLTSGACTANYYDEGKSGRRTANI